MRTLEERLRVVEREVTWYRRAALALLFLLVAAAAAKKPAPVDEIKGRRFVLTDKSGTERGALELDMFGNPSLKLKGAGGSIALTTDGGVPRVALADGAGHDRLWIALRLGSPAIQFLGTDGTAKTGITTMNDDTGIVIISEADGVKPGIALYDKKRTIVWSAPN